MKRPGASATKDRHESDGEDATSDFFEALRNGKPKPGMQSEWLVAFPKTEAIPLRVAISPMHTVIASIFEALAGQPRGAPQSWLRYVRSQCRGLDLAPLRVFSAEIRYPDFLTPDPASTRSSFAEQLAAIRSTPHDRVKLEIATTIRESRAERRAGGEPIEEVPKVFWPYLQDPGPAVERVCRALEDYWRRVFAPLWGRIDTVLERELIVLGHALATEGHTAMLGRTSPRLFVDDRGNLRWRSMRPGNASFAFMANRLLLVPMLCGPDGLVWGATEDRALIGYAAPRTSLLWEAADKRTGEGLSSVMGPTRAQIMLAVQTPTTTSDVADQLGLSTSLVSHHLIELQRLALVDGVRFGRRVYYRLAPRGFKVRDALGED
jgi:DNA-binding transcriptional ArsR family regulator